MAGPYSSDLRQRVVKAVEEGGMSRRGAAARFGVAISTATKWVRRYRETGSLSPERMGGCKPRKISGTHSEWLAQRCRNGAFTLHGLVGELAERGLAVDYRSVWNFVHEQKLTYKKRQWSPRNGTDRMSPAVEPNGSHGRSR